MTVKLVTFKTNHTIIADVVSDNGIVMNLKQPLQVVIQPSPQGNMMAFVPFVEFCDEFKTGIPIKVEDILTTTTPVVELLNKYNEVFGSGIQIAKTLPKGS